MTKLTELVIEEGENEPINRSVIEYFALKLFEQLGFTAFTPQTLPLMTSVHNAKI